ncbi:MAG: T9SS type A sorting domain-containing protein [Chitinophagaceae bacterium]|nr:T9SS type A sorting domain-containing protein [Chitinophagaceae bacterium]
MKTKHLLLVFVMMIVTAFAAIAQNAADKKFSVPDIPFGKKLLPPDFVNYPDKLLPQITPANKNTALIQTPGIHNTNKKSPGYFRQLLQDRRKMQTTDIDEQLTANARAKNTPPCNSNFHLIKDITALAESNPHNYPNYFYDINYNYVSADSHSFAVLNNIIYFVADDGIHGNELWRSDGTAAGTFLLKDIEPGAASSSISNITTANGKIYFANSSQLWVCDGTENGTQILSADVYDPGQFFSINNIIYFIADGIGYRDAIWQTDGTTAGTVQVINLGIRASGGELISQPTLVNGTLFFTFLDYETFSWQVWKSDLTDAGTYHVGPAYPFLDSDGNLTNYIPAQLTSYNNKLYFSANDGSGRKLWLSDGTDAGTQLAPGNHNAIIGADFLGTDFPVLNNILYLPGESTTHDQGLYKYDASDEAGLVKIKNFAPDGDTAFIVPSEMIIANNALYFKVISYTGGIHNELWSSKGTRTSTQLITSGEVINNLYVGDGTLYFEKGDRFFGIELWKIFNTAFGSVPTMQSDIFKGNPGSYPTHFTAFKGKLVFSAADEKKGNELFITNSFGFGATLVKDINTTTTATSRAGYNPYNYLGYTGMVTLGKEVLFTAYERAHGKELYKSNGTSEGTKLLNDVVPGDAGFEAISYISKNNAVYFIAESKYGYSIYKTKGTKNSLRKITPYYSGLMITFAVADNGLVFYSVFNKSLRVYELWRSNGTTAGTYLLSSTIYFSVYSYLNTAGNTAFFVAGDAQHGYELWKSDGSIAGTRLVKDINPGPLNSLPGGMFVYKNEVYFAAMDKSDNAHPNASSFWKSDGTESGTIKLKNIDPWYGRSVSINERSNFEVSNGILYFSAVDASQNTQFYRTDGTVAGTKVVKDINPNVNEYTANPSNFLDVNGTLYFTGNDGINGIELWKSDGTKEGTQLVKDITAGSSSTKFYGFASAGGKLYFSADVNGTRGLWSSDGTADGTQQVTDPCISGVGFMELYPAGDKLIFAGNTPEYGLEVYAGKVNGAGKFVASRIIAEDTLKTTLLFNAVLYPNPTTSSATLLVTGSTKNISVSIADMNGKVLWQSNNIQATLIKLPTEKYAAGIYIVTVTSGTESKTIKILKL